MAYASILVLAALSVGGITGLILPDPPAQGDISQDECTSTDTSHKDLDLIVYGATGFTGKLTSFFLANDSQAEGLRWAMAARDSIKLDYIAGVAASGSSRSTHPEKLTFGLKNSTRLLEIVRRAKVVLNFAGPYEANGGEALIRAALSGCAHYVDIAGEIHWKAAMLRKYAPVAEARGLAIVQSAGFTSMAADFLAMSAIEEVMDAQNEPPTHVMVIWTKLNDAVSGGQVETKNHEWVHGVNYDPYVLVPEVPKLNKVDWSVDGMDDYAFHAGLGMMAASPIGAKDCPVIRRSIQLRDPNSAISVREAVVNNTVELRRAGFLTNKTVLAHEEPIKEHPLPGEGPPRWVLKQGSFKGYAIAKGKLGGGAGVGSRVTLEGSGDPFFQGSARMASMLAVSLASRGLRGKGGYLTPTAAVGTRRLEALLEEVDAGKFVTVTRGDAGAH